MKVKFIIRTNIVGCECEDTLEFDDNITDEELEKEWKEWVWENIDGYWKKID